MCCWFWLLLLFTCWSWELGAQWCGPLGLCRVQTGHNPLMSVAPHSVPGSSETGTLYQFRRCQKTLDLKVERCLCYSSGVLQGYFDLPKEKYGFVLPLHYRGVRVRGQLQKSTQLLIGGFQCPAHRDFIRVDVYFDPAVPAEEQFPCKPAAGIPIVSHPKCTTNKDKPFLPFSDEVLWLAWPVFLSTYQQGNFSFHFTWEN